MKVYLINLARHPERRRRIEIELVRSGLDVVWKPGLDGARLKERPRPARTFPGAYPSPRTILSRFEIACLVSHRMAWRRLLNSNDQHCVIVEDDVYFGQGFADLVKSDGLAQAPFDLVKLERTTPRILVDKGRASVVGSRKIFPLKSHAYGTGGYALNRKAAKSLLRLTRGAPDGVDHILFNVPRLREYGLLDLRIGQLVPSIVIQAHLLNPDSTPEVLQSYIADKRGSRVGREPISRSKIIRELTRPLNRARFSLMSIENPFE